MKKCYFLLLLATAMLILSGNSTAQNLPAYLPSDGLVAWYPFNGNANDESGNGNDGVVNGATLGIDRGGNSNRSYIFNGNSYIFANDVNAISLGSNPKSFCLWMKSNNTTSPPNKDILNWGNATTSQRFGFTMFSGLPYFVGQNSDFYCNTAIGDNLWHFVTVSYDGITVSVFIDGFLDNFQTKILNTTGSDLVIGRSPLMHDSPTYFVGLLDDIAIYNRALTQEEITALYTGTPVNNNGGNTSANAVPPGIPYQAVVRNANGQVAANAAATTKFTLHQNTTDGAVEYQETHALTTNAQGLVSAVIGQGTAVQGTFAGINWSNTTKFLQVEVDLGNGYVDLGTQQLMSVPFALYAANGPVGPQGPAGADGADGATGPAGNDGQDGSSISSVVIQNNHLMVTLSNGTVMDAGAVLTEGCTNSTACNYSSSALYDNGSCLIVAQTCDDGDENTYQDMVTAGCNCAGTPSSFQLGDTYGGGVIAYLDETGQHGLIVAPADIAQAPQGCFGTWINGTSGAVGAGQSSTNAILAVCSTPGIAARLCDEYVLNGFTDWYLPTVGEMQLCYNNLYLNGLGNFAGYWYYWTSTIGNEYYGPSYTFQQGGVYDVNRQDALFVRPVRSF